ncbi:hypothetical protein B0H17DRAFT_1115924 [Mycena rosella]|uniref:Uncharacterized protein n=1 Tax=Mycena rosella TaxID=1033263 RepID=A0AAD7BAG9_MYCRO|nr:hypothetical protein B0H17DRAFT_1115924 [Mycena rosella]
MPIQDPNNIIYIQSIRFRARLETTSSGFCLDACAAGVAAAPSAWASRLAIIEATSSPTSAAAFSPPVASALNVVAIVVAKKVVKAAASDPAASVAVTSVPTASAASVTVAFPVSTTVVFPAGRVSWSAFAFAAALAAFLAAFLAALAAAPPALPPLPFFPVVAARPERPGGGNRNSLTDASVTVAVAATVLAPTAVELSTDTVELSTVAVAPVASVESDPMNEDAMELALRAWKKTETSRTIKDASMRWGAAMTEPARQAMRGRATLKSIVIV